MGLTIGQVARRAGVGVETIRYYERQGLMPAPPRRKSGYRQYPEEAVNRLQFIRRAKELGFTLKEIEELLSLRIQSQAGCDDVRARAEAKIADIDERLRSLRRMKKALADLTDACRAGGPISECPIVAALEQETL